jgi:peptide/nickel transport system substrate-binding protein
MKERSRVNRGLIIGIVLFLIALPLFAKEAPAEPKPQGTLRIALAGLAEEGFLIDMGDFEQGRAWPLVYDYPFYVRVKTREAIPGLGERYEYSKDGLTLTLYLRKGVPWQDTEKWGEVTAEDVKYSYERIMRKASTSLVKRGFDKNVKSIEVVDRHTVALHLKQTAPEFWEYAFGLLNAGPAILCKKYIETVGDEKARYHPIGSGPYRVVEHKPGEYLKFEAFDKHWRIVPEFKYIILQIVPEESTRIAMLRTGETDIAPISAHQMAELQKAPGVNADVWPGGYSIVGCFGGMTPPGDKRYKEGYHMKDPWVDRRVREAMALAVDREAIVKSVYKGAATPMAVSWTLPGWDELPPVPYDPEKAKKLLAEAGYPNGFDMTVIAASRWAPAHELPQVMEIVAAYFETIGLKVKIKAMDKPALRRLHRATKDAGLFYPWKETYKLSWAGRHYVKFVPGADPVLFSSDELTALINKYETELDPKKRVAALGEIRDYRFKHKVTVPLILANPVWAWRTDKVGEWPKTPIDKTHLFDYIRHVKPLNTWRLFSP